MNQTKLSLPAATRDPEQWLLERLKDHGVDVYAPEGPFSCLRDRLATVIVDNQFGSVVAGRHNGKPERYEQLFERIYGIKLSAKGRIGKANHGGDVPRGTPDTSTQQSNLGI